MNGRSPDLVLQTEDVSVASWSPGKDDEGIPPTQVHILARIPELDLTLVMRLKSRKVTDEIIAALQAHRDFVWPA